jgi:hypothetical protein
VDEVGPDRQRFTDDFAPVASSAATTYSGVTTLPKRRAPLSVDGKRLGWVWTDGVTAAGWEPAEQTAAAVRAGAEAWTVAAAAAREGQPVIAVLEPDRYLTGYTLGAPTA